MNKNLFQVPVLAIFKTKKKFSLAFLESYATNLEFEKCLVIFGQNFLNFDHSAPFGFTKKKSFFFLAYTFASMAKGRCYRGRNHWLGCILLINKVNFKKNFNANFYLQQFTLSFFKRKLKIFILENWKFMLEY